MKKIYSLLMLVAMFMLGTATMFAQAEKRYGVPGGSIGDGQNWTLDDIQVGVPFVLQTGISDETDFVRLDAKSSFINDNNLFVLEKDGENAEGEPQYVLKLNKDGRYLMAGSYQFDASKARAWRFCIVEPVPYTADDVNANPSESIVETWRNATTFAGAVDGNNLIFVDAAAKNDTTVTKKDNVRFLLSNTVGKSAYFGNNLGQNLWKMFPVVELTAAEYLSDALAELFPDATADLYNPGTEPGQISQELYDELTGSYAAAENLVNNMSTDHEACVAAYERCKKALEAARTGAVRIQAGYYFFKGTRNENNATYDDGEGLHWTYQKTWERPEVLDVENAKYVWRIIPIEGEDGFYIQNYYTKRYVNTATEKGASVKTTVDPQERFLIYPQDKDDFVIESTTLKANPIKGWNGEDLTALHCPADLDNVVMWTTTAEASGWVFLNVPLEQVQALEDKLAQAKLNDTLKSMLGEATALTAKGYYWEFVGGSHDGHLDMEEDGETPAGLLKSIDNIFCNMPEAAEGPLDEILDSNIGDGNFFHSDWNGAYPHAEAYPYLQVDLGKAVSDVAVKMWARKVNDNDYRTGNAPGRVNIWATNTPDDEESWVNIANGVRPEYPWGRFVINADDEEEEVAAGTVGYFDAHLGAPYQHVRFEVTHRYSDRNNDAADFKLIGNDAGNFNLGEIRVFESVYDKDKSLAEGVPAAVREALEKAIANAQAELEAESATQATIDALKKAMEAFNDAYPDPVTLNNLVAEAEAQYKGAEEGNDVGYFQAGAKAELLAATEAVKANLKSVMTVDEINTLTAQIRAALATFAAKLNLPEVGKFYYIQSATTDEQTGSAMNGGRLSAGGNSARVKWYDQPAADEKGFRIEGNPAYVWKFMKQGNGYVFRNALTGEYINNPKEDNVGVYMSTQADTCAFTFQSAKVPGLLNVVCEENIFLNAQPATYNLVTWGAADGADNSSFIFTEVEDEMLNEIYWPINAGKTTFLTLPVAVESDGYAYSVAGRGERDGQATVELSVITGDIAEGTPFVYMDESEADWVAFKLAAKATDYEGLMAEAATEAKTVNGFVGTLAAIESLHVSYGILFEGRAVVDSKPGEGVGNNSAYLNPTVSAADGQGDAYLPLDGKVDAIEGVVDAAAPAVVNVYNLSGVKVRSNVKSMNDLNGLPAGIYIMGNKKVLVK